MSKLFPNLFSPFEIRGKPFKNRLFLAPHGTGYAENGGLGDRGFAYYEARVKNHIALLTSEASPVVPSPGRKYAQLSAGSDDSIPHFRRLADLCRNHNCRYIGQIYHEGRAHAHLSEGCRDVAVAPSALPDERFHIVPRALSIMEIEDLVSYFGDAAKRLSLAGADGVELLVGMGYLHAQFLSPGTNVRSDRYGGSLLGRSRFLRETLLAMRERTGEDFVIGFRIVPDEPDPDGQSPGESVEVCRMMANEGLCDYISVTVGGTHSYKGASMIAPAMFVDAGATLELSKRVRSVVDIPIMMAGRINQPQLAEQAIAEGCADLVGSVRAYIADPEFAAKAAADNPEAIRACIACNQACIGHRQAGFGVSCIQFPETGRELEYANLKPANPVKQVSIIGGGPGGMKAACVAASRGHQVTLYERSANLGGQALLAQSLPGRTEFGGLITNLEGELSRHGVVVKKNHEVTSDLICEENPDVVVVATGAVPLIPQRDLTGCHVVTAWDVIRGDAELTGNVLVADWRCDWVGPGVAELLAANGHYVRLCVNGEAMGQSVQSYVRHSLAGRLHGLGVEVIPYLRLFGADDNTVYMQHIINEDAVLFEDIGTLVLAYGHQSVNSLSSALNGHIPEIYAIGDCLNPRTAEEAVLEGLKTGAII